MNISGTVLFNKVREIIPGLPPSMSPELLNRLCEDPLAQPFLNWFCTNVTRENVLSNEEIEIKKHLQNTGQWLQGAELDSALEEATKDCSELLRLITPEALDSSWHHSELLVEKEAYNEELSYLQSLKESTEELEEQEDKLSEKIESEETLIEKDRIEVEEVYKDCVDIFRELDVGHKGLFIDVERLLNIYADAAEKKGPPIVWTQMPLDVYRKEMDMYYNYLAIYIKRIFGDKNILDTIDSDYVTLMEDSKSRRPDDLEMELAASQKKLLTSKMEEINARVQEESASAMAEYAEEIYNDGNCKIPQSQTQLQLEIIELSGKSIFLDENMKLLQEQLQMTVAQLVQRELMQILVQDSRERLERRRDCFEKSLQVQKLAQEHGYAHSDLICMLIQLQQRHLTQTLEFIKDARYYLATEYSLSANRLDVMQTLQAEYKALLSASPSEQNVFNKIFISIVESNDDEDALTSSIKQFDRLREDNKADEEKLFGADLDARINSTHSLEKKVSSLFIRETNDGPTVSLKQTPYKLVTRFENATARVAELQGNVTTIHQRLKDVMRKGITTGLERDKQILWQRFLAEPETLRRQYEEIKSNADHMHFTASL